MPAPKPLVAIACGGTGGHLFPGLAVGDELRRAGCEVLLLVSPKEVDQQALRGVSGMGVATLPAVGFTRGRRVQFLLGSIRSYRICRSLFRERPPRAVLSMGGFTSVGPILAGRRCGAATFLHESNAVPGRANRWLAHFVAQVFVGFEQAARRLPGNRALRTGTPVRPEFCPRDPGPCREALGLDADRPVLLVVGGSQGASAINGLVIDSLAALQQSIPGLQYIHLAGPRDEPLVRDAYQRQGARSVVKGFLSEMDVALGAATVALSRAGASSLAEFATMRVPVVLIPYPTAADNHQFHNAQELTQTGAARLLEQRNATPGTLVSLVRELILDPECRGRMTTAIAAWHTPDAANRIADAVMRAVGVETCATRCAGSGPDRGPATVSRAMLPSPAPLSR